LLGVQRDLNGSVAMLEKANALLQDEPRLMTDLGRSYAYRGYVKSLNKLDGASDYTQAEDLFKRSLALNPKYGDTYQQWAISLYNQRKYSEAWRKIHEVKKIDGKNLDPRFLEALEKELPDPDKKAR